jgi:signal transduction histidine kinase
MVYFDKFIPPFDRLVVILMPWKGLHSISENVMADRINYMHQLLDASDSVSTTSFVVMTISFILFSAYLTFVYQQRKSRARENRLLHLKNQEIARRNEFIRYISATIGHEFKNNLGRIKRRLDLLKDIPNEAHELIYVNLDKLFADIAIFKKISDEREAVLTDFVKVDFKQLIADMAEQYRDLAQIKVDDSFTSTSIYASVKLLTTVFENLFDNAVKYKKPEQEYASIVITLSKDMDGSRRYLRLSFKDDGIGMDEYQADNCFYKGVDSESGWGQGLYFAKYVIGLHAGKIRVGKEHTGLDLGTEIIISLPYVEETLHV